MLTLTTLVKLADKMSSSPPSEAVSVSSQDVSTSTAKLGVCRSPENGPNTLLDMHL